MIIALDFTGPRKLSYNVINGLIFDLKMKKQQLNKYKKATLLALISLAIKNGSILIADSAVLRSQFNIYEMGRYLELYGIPTCYYKIELLKVKENIFQSMVVIGARVPESLRSILNPGNNIHNK